jgi:acyl-CoA synthetase (NDP forming)/RimJ/RimL family protein N-acetyltransferase
MSEPFRSPAGVYALLADGRTVQIRPAAPEDFAAVEAMHRQMSPDNAYLRFFSLSRTAAEQEARRVTREPGPSHAALLAVYGGQVVGVASYEAERDSGGKTAEIAFAVADTMHQRGIATLLLEHLVSLARARQVETFVAETLSENIGMLRVFSDAGLPVTPKRADGVVRLTMPLPPDEAGQRLDAYRDTVAARERSANVASLRPVFQPASVAVVGASRRPGTVGRAVLENIKSGGYRGRLYAVNPNATEIGGVASFPDVASLPETPDLALLAVPPAEVVDTADACGRLGVRGLVVFAAAVDGPASAGLLAVCRRHGMRLIGPNCFGIAVPSIGLDATFAAAIPLAGTAGLVMQSGGLGLAMADHLTRLGIGISSFASVGNKLDVSSNDMLQWWERDGQTRVAVLYIESFGNPRKFARTARRVGARIPVLTVHAGRSEDGQRAAASHTSSTSTPLVTREALFEQAGIIATASFGELMEATALLATQSPPVGRTVAIVSNVGGAAVLAADACTDLGLAVHHPRGQTARRLRELIPEGGSVRGPVDTAATVSADDFRQVLEALSDDADVHAIIALTLRTGATGDLAAAIADAIVTVPLATVVLDQPEAVRLIDAKGGKVPAYAYPEAAARALARAARYAQWRAAPRAAVPAFADVDAERGRALVRGFLAREPDGGWLPAADVVALLRLYGIALGSAAASAGGAEVAVSVTDDTMFGPLVALGVGRAASGSAAAHAARLAPLTSADVDMLVGSLHYPPPLDEYLAGLGGQPTPAADALRDALLRVSRLAEDVPEVAELELAPVIVDAAGAVAAAARIRVAPPVPQDPFLRKLRLPAGGLRSRYPHLVGRGRAIPVRVVIDVPDQRPGERRDRPYFVNDLRPDARHLDIQGGVHAVAYVAAAIPPVINGDAAAVGGAVPGELGRELRTDDAAAHLHRARSRRALRRERPRLLPGIPDVALGELRLVGLGEVARGLGQVGRARRGQHRVGQRRGRCRHGQRARRLGPLSAVNRDDGEPVGGAGGKPGCEVAGLAAGHRAGLVAVLEHLEPVRRHAASRIRPRDLHPLGRPGAGNQPGRLQDGRVRRRNRHQHADDRAGHGHQRDRGDEPRASPPLHRGRATRGRAGSGRASSGGVAAPGGRWLLPHRLRLGLP